MNLLLSVAFPYSGMMSRQCLASCKSVEGKHGDLTVTFMPVRGGNIPRARNAAAKVAVSEAYDQVLFVDSDMEFDIASVKEISKACEDKTIVGGAYISRDSRMVCGGNWGEVPGSVPESKRLFPNHVRGIHAVDWVGSGFLCVDVEALEDSMTFPYFTYNMVEFGSERDQTSDDVGFCMNAGVAGIPVFCYVGVTNLVHRPMVLPDCPPDIDLRDWLISVDRALDLVKKLGNNLAGDVVKMLETINGAR